MAKKKTPAKPKPGRPVGSTNTKTRRYQVWWRGVVKGTRNAGTIDVTALNAQEAVRQVSDALPTPDKPYKFSSAMLG